MCEVASFKNFENSLATVKVMTKTKVAPFIWDTVYLGLHVCVESSCWQNIDDDIVAFIKGREQKNRTPVKKTKGNRNWINEIKSFKFLISACSVYRPKPISVASVIHKSITFTWHGGKWPHDIRTRSTAAVVEINLFVTTYSIKNFSSVVRSHSVASLLLLVYVTPVFISSLQQRSIFIPQRWLSLFYVWP